MSDSQDSIYWLALNCVPKVGAVTAARLLGFFERPSRVFKSNREDLESLGLPAEAVASIISQKPLEEASRESQLIISHGGQVISQEHPHYPQALKEMPGHPPVLIAKGDTSRLNTGLFLAVVGSRKASPYGIMATQTLVRDLAQAGVSIVSGFALGIDIAAHLAAVQVGGYTAAVLGSGFGNIYPSQNKKYVSEIEASGVFLSEFPWKMDPLAANFPRRNRVVSGMARGTLVVEADEKSGSLITARLAADQNRDVYAVPGRINSPVSRGCNALIKQGARIVTCAQDILDDWKYPLAAQTQLVELADPKEKLFFESLGEEGSTLDDLAQKTGWAVTDVTVMVTQMELSGKIKSLPGNKFVSLIS